MPQSSSTEVLSADEMESLLHSVLEPAYNFAFRLTRDRADAEDLLQEASLRVCRSFHQFTPGTNFRAWFFRILANCFKHDLRHESRRGTSVSIEDAPPLHLFNRSAEAGLHTRELDPASALLARLDVDEVVEALEALPEVYRTVALLYFVEDFTYPEIAEVLEIPVGTVRSRLHRGRKLLQSSLWDLAVDNGIIPGIEGE